MSEKIGIRPDVGVLSVLRYLNYKPWYALAEYVDNAIDSYLRCKQELVAADGTNYQLQVEIDINASARIIRVTDNAAGINATDLDRALQTAKAPPDRSRLSEFGMGMKAASCWFAPVWSLQTKALGDAVARYIQFDVPKIVECSTQEVEVAIMPKPPSAHHTIIQLSNLFEPLPPKTIEKIAEHLASLYRGYLQSGELALKLNGKLLSYSQPEILTAPAHNSEGGAPIRWYQEVAFECAGGRTVRGFAAIREVGSTAKAGFALFRRGRVIIGSTDEGYRPEHIFGRGNSYRSQRLFGELHLEGFGVSHTKDGFQWEGCHDEFLEKLYKELSGSQMPMLAQAEKYRKREDKPVAKKSEAVAGHTSSASGVAAPAKAPDIHAPINTPPARAASRPSAGPAAQGLLPFIEEAQSRTATLTYKGLTWQVQVELSSSYAFSEWLDVGDHLLKQEVKAAPTVRQLGLRIALNHPFAARLEARYGSRELLMELAIGLAVAQATAIDGGATNTSLLLDYFGDVLALPIK